MTLATELHPPLPAVTALPDAEERRRFRYFVRSAAGSVYLLAAGFALGGLWTLAALDALVATGFVGLLHWGLARHSRLRLLVATHLTLTWGLIAIVCNALLTGGNTSFALWFLATLPLLSAFLGGRHAAWVWAGISVLTAVLAWGLPHWGWTDFGSPAPLPPAMLLVAHVVLVALSTTFAQAARVANDRHIQLLGEKLAAEQEAKRLAETSRLMEERARLAAEAASRTKTRFLATMSHEMRTPLNAVIGFNTLLLDMGLSARERELAELAQQSGEALLQLINDILDFSKIESGHLVLEPLVFNPHIVAKGAIALVTPQARAKGLELVSDIDAPAGVRGDPSRLRQILVNLLTNAVKFTDKGRITLRCRPQACDDGRAWLRFEVEDTGIGIATDLQPRLFQPFTQADASTTRRFGGTGLGLAICRELATLMGGSISLASSAGAGATFRVELPFEAVPEAEWPNAALTSEWPNAAEPACHCRVLLAEDNAVNQIMAREMLKRLGCQVDVVANGREAVEAWQRLPYDVIFMDCDMPELDGFDACREIRRLEAGRSHVPVVAITAAAVAGDREKCLEAGMDDYLPKPVRFADMRIVLERCCPLDLPVV